MNMAILLCSKLHNIVQGEFSWPEREDAKGNAVAGYHTPHASIFFI